MIMSKELMAKDMQLYIYAIVYLFVTISLN